MVEYKNGRPMIAGMLPTGGALPDCGCRVTPQYTGMGHGPTSGLGGADWTAGCGVYRGPAYSPNAPSFSQLAKNATACAKLGVGTLCSPSAPLGVWLLPFLIDLPPLGVDTKKVITLPSPGRLIAFEVTTVRDSAGVDSTNLVNAKKWEARSQAQTYPRGGRDTTFVPDGDFNLVPVPVSDYNRSRILDGQQVLPPWVPNVDLENGNDEIGVTFTNDAPVLTVTVKGYLWIAYGKFAIAGE